MQVPNPLVAYATEISNDRAPNRKEMDKDQAIRKLALGIVVALGITLLCGACILGSVAIIPVGAAITIWVAAWLITLPVVIFIPINRVLKDDEEMAFWNDFAGLPLEQLSTKQSSVQIRGEGRPAICGIPYCTLTDNQVLTEEEANQLKNFLTEKEGLDKNHSNYMNLLRCDGFNDALTVLGTRALSKYEKDKEELDNRFEIFRQECIYNKYMNRPRLVGVYTGNNPDFY